MSSPKIFPVTTLLIAISVAVALMTSLGGSIRALQPFLIANFGSIGYQNISDGQVWRLLTPLFIHFGIVHLALNMMWLWDLGRTIEARRGSLFFAAFVVLVGVASNITQYSLNGSPNFGGMSGVVYGMLGYAWAQQRYNPRFGFAVQKSTVTMMLVWLALCWTGLMGSIGNWAHTAGLLIGVAWGYMGSVGERRR